jgi:hypothetical protein
MSVDIDVRGDALEIYYNRDLRARYNFETGAELPLDEIAESPAKDLSAAVSSSD